MLDDAPSCISADVMYDANVSRGLKEQGRLCAMHQGNREERTRK